MDKFSRKFLIYTLLNISLGLLFIATPLLILVLLVSISLIPLEILTIAGLVLDLYLLFAIISMDISAFKYGLDVSLKLKSERNNDSANCS